MNEKRGKIRLAIPKGSLQEHTLRVFREAGFDINVPNRSYILDIDDPDIDCFMLRPQEIPMYLQQGKLDVGISGEDWVREQGADVVEICDLLYAKQDIKKVKWVLAVPEKSNINSPEDLEGKTIATELVNTVSDYFRKRGVNAKIEFSWGATEVKAVEFADAVVDITETGASLRAHNLKVIDTIMESSTKLIANKDSLRDAWKKQKIEDLALLLEGIVKSEQLVGIMMHVSEPRLKTVLELLDIVDKPTVKKLAGEEWFDVCITCQEKQTRELIPQLKEMGCEGIVEFPIGRMIA